MEIFACKQCGEVKDQSTFRKYPKSEKRRPRCMKCEAINNRYRYIAKQIEQGNTSQTLLGEKKDIEHLYALLNTKGLTTPIVAQDNVRDNIMRDVKQMVSNLEEELATVPKVTVDDGEIVVPAPIVSMLEREFVKGKDDPDELRSDVDELWSRYAPVVGMSEDYITQYDTTFTDYLNNLYVKVDDFEESLIED